jgi:hypothetical protein
LGGRREHLEFPARGGSGAFPRGYRDRASYLAAEMPDRLTLRFALLLAAFAFGLAFVIEAAVGRDSSPAQPAAERSATGLVAEAPGAEPDLQLAAARTVPALLAPRRPRKRRVHVRKRVRRQPAKRRVVVRAAPKVRPAPVMPAETAQPAPTAAPRYVPPAPRYVPPAPRQKPAAPKSTPAPASTPPTSGEFDTTGGG